MIWIADVVNRRRGGSKGGGWGRPHSKVCPPVTPNEVHHADILTEVTAIASLGLQMQVCQ